MRVSAMPPSRWTKTPLFYSQSTDLPVLRGRRCGDGAPERPQTGGYKINLRFRRFGSGTGQITGLSAYYIGFIDRNLHGGSATPELHDLVHLGTRPKSATISPSTFTMDHNAIICFMIDRLTRGPDQDVHVPSVGSPKYPSRGVDLSLIHI